MGHGFRTWDEDTPHSTDSPRARDVGPKTAGASQVAQPPGQHRIGLAGAWACSGARVGWRGCDVKGLKGERPDPGHSPDPVHRPDPGHRPETQGSQRVKLPRGWAGPGSSPHRMPGAPAPMQPSCGQWAGPRLLITRRGRGLAGGSLCARSDLTQGWEPILLKHPGLAGLRTLRRWARHRGSPGPGALLGAL